MRRLLGGAVAVASAAFIAVGLPARAASAAQWVAAWSAPASTSQVLPGMQNYTCRFPLRSTVGGSRIQVRVGNVLAPTAATFSKITIEPAVGPLVSLNAASTSPVTFGGSSSLALRPGDQMWSDPVALSVKPGEDLWLDLWVVGTNVGQTQHGLGLEPMGCGPAGSGDRTGIEQGGAFPDRAFGDAWVDALAVWTSTASAGAVATIGDSLTDGYCAPRFRHARWTDVLAARTHGLLGVANAGIDGDTIVSPAGLAFGPTALGRWQRDIASLPDVRTVVIFEGSNDLIYGTTATQLENGYRQLVALAHAAGMKAIGATLLPRANPAESPSFELERRQVNQAIRDGSIGFDRVIDFDHVVGLANDSDIQNQFDCGDHVHLNRAGYQALGDAFPLPLAH